MHADAAAGGAEDVAVVRRVCEVGQAGVGLRTRSVDFGRTLHGERLVWPFGVEFLDKVVEAAQKHQKSPCAFIGGPRVRIRLPPAASQERTGGPARSPVA